MASAGKGEGEANSPNGVPKPDWSDGLRQLYDSVVEEELPDSFRELLDKLDSDAPSAVGTNDNASNGGSGGGE